MAIILLFLAVIAIGCGRNLDETLLNRHAGAIDTQIVAPPNPSEVTITTQAAATSPTRSNPTSTVTPSSHIETALASPTRLNPSSTAAPPLDSNAAAIEMTLIPAGEFQMGSGNGDDIEKPVHTVYLEAYSIDIYEVTNARYAECVKAGACTEPAGKGSVTRSSYYGSAQYADYPVIYVDWQQAQIYCEWRGGSLPTEAQWEKAARGGLEGRDYPWGDTEPDCQKANFRGCSADTQKVGSRPPNGYGLYDMAGNVWELVWDWYSDSFYAGSPRDNPTDATQGVYRLLRGGSWYDVAWYQRVSQRGRINPNLRNNDFGLRCVRDP